MKTPSPVLTPEEQQRRIDDAIRKYIRSEIGPVTFEASLSAYGVPRDQIMMLKYNCLKEREKK